METISTRAARRLALAPCAASSNRSGPACQEEPPVAGAGPVRRGTFADRSLRLPPARHGFDRRRPQPRHSSRCPGLKVSTPALAEELLAARRAAVRVLGPRGVLAADGALSRLRLPSRGISPPPVVGRSHRASTPTWPKTSLRRIRDEGPLRSLDMEGRGSSGWWDLKVAKKVATALWSSGELAIRERRNFQRTYDLAERVIPDEYRENDSRQGRSALEDPPPASSRRPRLGHDRNPGQDLAVAQLLRAKSATPWPACRSRARIVPCALILGETAKKATGWIRTD